MPMTCAKGEHGQVNKPPKSTKHRPEDLRIALRKRPSLATLCEANGISSNKFATKADQVRTLEVFQVRSFHVADLSYFTHLTELKVIHQPQVKSLEGIGACKLLQRLWVTECRIADMEPLSNCTSLQELVLSRNRLTCITGLDKLKHLTKVWLSDNRITSLDGLSSQSALEQLNVAANCIGKVARHLDGLVNLSELNLAGNQITHFRELLNLSRRRDLKTLLFTDPHYGDNPVSRLCNFQTYVLYNLPTLSVLDGVVVTTDLVQIAESTYVRKKMYYNMRIKTTKRNVNNIVKDAKTWTTRAIDGIAQVAVKLERVRRDVGSEISDLEQQLYAQSQFGYDQQVETEEGEEKEEADSHTSPTSSTSGLTLPHVGASMFSLFPTRPPHAIPLNTSLNTDSSAVHIPAKLSLLQRKLSAIDHEEQHLRATMKQYKGMFGVWRSSVLQLSQDVTGRLVKELETGGNVRFESCTESHTGFGRCEYIIHNAFDKRAFEAVGVSGIQVDSVSKVHNRILRHRFDTQVEKQARRYRNSKIPKKGKWRNSSNRPGAVSGADGHVDSDSDSKEEQLPIWLASDDDDDDHDAARTRATTPKRQASARRNIPQLVKPSTSTMVTSASNLVLRNNTTKTADVSSTTADVKKIDQADSECSADESSSSSSEEEEEEGDEDEEGEGPTGSASDDPEENVSNISDINEDFTRSHIPKTAHANAISEKSQAGISYHLLLEHLPSITSSQTEQGATNTRASDVVEFGLQTDADAYLVNNLDIEVNNIKASLTKNNLTNPRNTTDALASSAWNSGHMRRRAVVVKVYDPSHLQENQDTNTTKYDKCITLPEYIVEFKFLLNDVLYIPGSTSVPDTRQVNQCIERVIKEGVTDQDRADLLPLLHMLIQYTSDQPNLVAEQAEQRVLSLAKMMPTALERQPIVALDSSVLRSLVPAIRPADLRYLNLHAVSLSQIQNLDMCTNLKVLVLSFNDITVIEGLTALTNLVVLDLGFNHIISTGNGLKSLRKLRVLKLDNNEISHFDEVLSLRQSLPKLSDLDLSNNPICEGKSYFWNTVRCLSSLTMLDKAVVTAEAREASVRGAVKLSIDHVQRYGRCVSEQQTVPLDSIKSEAFVLGNGDSLSTRGTPRRRTNHHHNPVGAEHSTSFFDVRAVEELNLQRLHLRRIENLEQCTGLRRLCLSDNEISHIEGLHHCELLEELVLDENEIVRVANLGNLHFLKSLDLGKNLIRVIEKNSLSGLKRLTQLSLEDNQIESLSGFGDLPCLMELYLCNNMVKQIKQILQLKALSKLTIVDMSGNALCEDPKYRMYSVYHLRNVKVMDGLVVRRAEQSKARDLYAGKLTLDFLHEKIGHQFFEHIRELDLSSCRIRDIEKLTGQEFSNIHELNLSNNLMVHLAGLFRLNGLKVLNLDNNRFDSLYLPDELDDREAIAPTQLAQVSQHAMELKQGIFALESLVVLQLNGNRIADIQNLRLRHLPKLRTLMLAANEISDLSGMETCTQLRELDLSKNKIRSLDNFESAFQYLVNLRTLQLEENGLRTLCDFSALTKLRTLTLNNNRIADNAEFAKVETCSFLLDITLASNPIARKPLYRASLINLINSLNKIDNKEISSDERERVNETFAADAGSAAAGVAQFGWFGYDANAPGLGLGIGPTSKVPIRLTSLNFEPLALASNRPTSQLQGSITQGSQGQWNVPINVNDTGIMGTGAAGDTGSSEVWGLSVVRYGVNGPNNPNATNSNKNCTSSSSSSSSSSANPSGSTSSSAGIFRYAGDVVQSQFQAQWQGSSGIGAAAGSVNGTTNKTRCPVSRRRTFVQTNPRSAAVSVGEGVTTGNIKDITQHNGTIAAGTKISRSKGGANRMSDSGGAGRSLFVAAALESTKTAPSGNQEQNRRRTSSSSSAGSRSLQLHAQQQQEQQQVRRQGGATNQLPRRSFSDIVASSFERRSNGGRGGSGSGGRVSSVNGAEDINNDQGSGRRHDNNNSNSNRNARSSFVNSAVSNSSLQRSSNDSEEDRVGGGRGAVSLTSSGLATTVDLRKPPHRTGKKMSGDQLKVQPQERGSRGLAIRRSNRVEQAMYGQKQVGMVVNNSVKQKLMGSAKKNKKAVKANLERSNAGLGSARRSFGPSNVAYGVVQSPYPPANQAS